MPHVNEFLARDHIAQLHREAAQEHLARGDRTAEPVKAADSAPAAGPANAARPTVLGRLAGIVRGAVAATRPGPAERPTRHARRPATGSAD